MKPTTERIYSSFVGFRAPPEFNDRLQRFSVALGRHKSDVIRYLIGRCLTAYEADSAAIEKIKRDLY
jgi:predicted DNA-binding protein